MGFAWFVVHFTTSHVELVPENERPLEMRAAVVLVWSEVVIAVCCVLVLLFAECGKIKRSPSTCYPIPAEVEDILKGRSRRRLTKNIDGPQGSPTLGTYCVRCYVWRPPSRNGKEAHHCSTCERCVLAFDHHCGVFGRCITGANMPFFIILILLMPIACVTMVLA